MTEKQKFINFMRKYGFSITSNFIGTMSLVPSHQKTTNDSHVLIDNIRFCIWGGSNVKEGDLGCVTLYYSGVKRKKYCKNSHQSEILKKGFCPKNSLEAIVVFKKWHKDTKEIRQSWKTIL